MNSAKERLVNGIVKENPTFVLMLGMCPTLAVTTSAVNGLGMGLTTMVVLALSNVFISLLRGIIPDKVRIPAFIVIIASFVTVVELLLQGYIPFLYDALGLYIPLIVVNCIILGRAEAYAYKNPVLPSLFDGIGMGLGADLYRRGAGASGCRGDLRHPCYAGELCAGQYLRYGAGRFLRAGGSDGDPEQGEDHRRKERPGYVKDTVRMWSGLPELCGQRLCKTAL